MHIAQVHSSPGDVEVSVEFAANSQAVGCIVIVANATREVVFVKYRSSGSTTDGFTITGLPPASYDVAVYDVKKDSDIVGKYPAANMSLILEEPSHTRPTYNVDTDTGAYSYISAHSTTIAVLYSFRSCDLRRRTKHPKQ